MKTGFRIQDMAIIALDAALLCVLAPLAIPAGPVPFTLATLAVYLCTAVTGMRRGTLSVLPYILIGAVGVPVFSGFAGGVQKLIGLTGGYLAGYVLCALAAGFLIDRFPHTWWVYPLAMMLGTVLLYLLGTVWFLIVGKGTLWAALVACVFPFIPFDILKIALATAVGYPVRHRLARRGLL